MNSRKNNLVVGLFIIMALILLLFGVYFLKETSPGQKTDTYTLQFDQVSTLQGGDPVKVNGVKVGKVTEIELKDNRVTVTAKVERGLRFPKDSQVRIQNIGLMGERQIGILLGQSPEVIPAGGILQGSLDAGIAEAMGVAGEVFVEAQTLVHSLRNVMDSTVNKPEFASTFNQLVKQTDELSKRMGTFMNEVDPQVKRSLNNLESASNQVNILIKDQNVPVRNIIKNGEDVSAKLKEVVAKADQMADQMNGLMTKVNSNKSTVGALLHDSAFYLELRSTLNSADSLFRRVEKKGLDVNVNLF